jgi:predicted DNA-binding protein YlxM (UPF0122 family)
MGRRTAVIAVADGDTKHYRSLSEAAEDNKVNKVDIWRAIRRGRRINGYFFDYETEVFNGNRERD